MSSIRLTELLEATLSPEQSELITKAETAVDNDVKDAIDEFRQKVQKRADRFAEGEYVKQFDSQLQSIKAGVDTALGDYKNEVSTAAAAAEKLIQRIENLEMEDLNELKAASKQIAERTIALNSKMDELRNMIENFSETGGRLAIKLVTKAIL